MLCGLFRMTLTAILVCGHKKLHVVISMTFITANNAFVWLTILCYGSFPAFCLPMSAYLPVLHNRRSLNGMTKNAFFILENSFILTAWRPIMLRIIPTNR